MGEKIAILPPASLPYSAEFQPRISPERDLRELQLAAAGNQRGVQGGPPEAHGGLFEALIPEHGGGCREDALDGTGPAGGPFELYLGNSDGNQA